MKLDKETVARIAHLARLEVSDAEREVLLEDMSKILGFMEKLNELDTTGVEPLVYLSDEVNVWRKDEVQQEITVQEALKNAPHQDGAYFKVPKVIDK